MKDLWDERYGGEEYIYGTTPNDFLKSNLEILPKGKVLCLADGEGRNSVFLAKNGFDVTSVDYSKKGIEKAKKLADKNNVEIEFIHKDLLHFEIEESYWNGIISIFCHLPPDIRKVTHQRSKNGLQKEGIFLLEAYSKEQLAYKTGGPKNEEMLYSKDVIEEDFSGLQIIMSKKIERNINESDIHNGLSSVIQFIAKK
ncbi:MAG: class I SAM-dependent methyltransferase [Ignavibacteria bacterium]|jgi:SAM-dependent methyltransferase